MDSLSNNVACETTCPIKKTADIIEGKWTTLIIRELLQGKKRFSDLEKGLFNISAKVLSARLRMLEENHLVTRHVYPTIPPTTEYELTPKGLQLKGVLLAMAEFGEKI